MIERDHKTNFFEHGRAGPRSDYSHNLREVAGTAYYDTCNQISLNVVNGHNPSALIPGVSEAMLTQASDKGTLGTCKGHIIPVPIETLMTQVSREEIQDFFDFFVGIFVGPPHFGHYSRDHGSFHSSITNYTRAGFFAALTRTHGAGAVYAALTSYVNGKNTGALGVVSFAGQQLGTIERE